MRGGGGGRELQRKNEQKGRVSAGRGGEQKGIHWSWSSALHSEESHLHICAAVQRQKCVGADSETNISNRCWHPCAHARTGGQAMGGCVCCFVPAQSCTVEYLSAHIRAWSPGMGPCPVLHTSHITVGICSTCTGARQSEEEKVDRRDPERCKHTHADRNVLIRSRQKVLGDFEVSRLLTSSASKRMIFLFVSLRCAQLRTKLQWGCGGSVPVREHGFFYGSLTGLPPDSDLADQCSDRTAIKHGKQSGHLQRSKEKAKIISSRHHIILGWPFVFLGLCFRQRQQN